MRLKRLKAKPALLLIVILFLISAAVSSAMLFKSQRILMWSDRSTGRSLVQLVILQQSYLTLLTELDNGEAVYEKAVESYDLTWSAYETLIKGTKNAYFMHDARRIAKLKSYFKQFKATDPIETPLTGTALTQAIHITDQAHQFIIGLLNYEYQGLSQKRHDRDVELVKINKIIVISLIGLSISAILFLLIIFNDKRRMAYRAYHDALTQIYNRSALQEKIVQLQSDNVSFCALLVDIDRFKSINDSYGHDVGDELLVYITQQMSEICGKSNFLGRLGGDEFAIVSRSPQQVELLASRLLSITSAPIPINAFVCDVGLSIGVSCSRLEHHKWVDILKDADDAMYQAKEKGGNQYQMYTAQ